MSKDKDQENTNLQFVRIPVSDDPEGMAEMLIQASLPRKFLDQIDISNDQGAYELAACLALRQHQASLEKDEIIRFTKRNERALRADALKPLIDAISTSKQVEEKLGKARDLFVIFEYFVTQVQHVLEGNPNKVDVKSDRLLWLIYALSLSVSAGFISYDKGLRILNKKEHKERISPLSVTFFIKDFIESIETPQQPGTEYLMFIIECALISNNITYATVGLLLLDRLDPPKEIGPWLDLISRLNTYLEKNGQVPSEGKKFIRRAFSRYRQKVHEDDF
jgi:hypothetical protein